MTTGQPRPRALILVYKDFEPSDPTIPGHLAILSEFDHVWWGWWKKTFEPERSSVFSELDKIAPFDVGLVNRDRQEYYRARCEEVRFAPAGGEPLEAPEADATPGYYRGNPCPAWLKLTDIQLVDLDAWKRLFGGVGRPEGDPSLYWLDESEPGQHPPPPVINDFETPGHSILHITDLHFGDYHGYSIDEQARDQGGPPLMVDRILEGIGDNDPRIGIVVVSGDLISRAEPDPLDHVVPEMLMTLCKRLDLTPEQVIIVPGNHDFPLDKVDEQAVHNFWHEDRFRQFMESFYGRKLEDLNYGARYKAQSGWGYTFIGLNSVRLRNLDLKNYGFVGSQRTDPLLAELAERNRGRTRVELAKDRCLNFVAMHHHLVPVERLVAPTAEHPMSVTLDAGQLIEDFQAVEIHAVMHGHRHVPLIGGIARNDHEWISSPMYVLAGGSCGAAQNHLGPEAPGNTFAIYTPRDTELAVDVFRFDQNTAPELRLHQTLALA